MSEPSKIVPLSLGDHYYYTNLSHGEYYGVHFNCAFRFNEFHVEVGVHSPTRCGTVRLGIYPWLGSGDRSLSAQVLYEQKYNLKDGYVLALNFKPLNPGEYFVALTGATEGAGFCGNFFTTENTELYLNGYKIPGSMKASIILCEEGEGALLPITPGKEKESTKITVKKEEKAEVNSENWIMTDGLCRKIKNDIPERKDKRVGMFYWDWHYNFAYNRPVNLNSLMKKYPEAKNDMNHQVWKNYAADNYFWNEPIFGYYDNRDKYVAEKHAEMLAEALVDFIVFDCTNGSFTWRDAYIPIFEAFESAKARGVNVPKIVFMLGFPPTIDTKVAYYRVYTDIYKPGRFSDLWYYVDGKPLILGRNDALDPQNPFDREILSFFYHRKNDPNYFSLGTDSQGDWWGWLSVTPQAKYGSRDDGSCEMICVSVAQNANKNELCAMNDPRGNVRGRSFSLDKKYRAAFPAENSTIYKSSADEDAMLFGINYQEQWDNAIAANPDTIFITGWNEWIASHIPDWLGTPGAFPDEFDDEYSRDIEPTKGVLRDYYYTQTIYNIRRFKGCEGAKSKLYDIGEERKNLLPTPEEWENAEPEKFYTASAPGRSHSGWKGEYYSAPSYSNVIFESRAIRDDNNLHLRFSFTYDIKKNDTLLFISDPKAGYGFESFNLLIGRVSHADGTVSVERLETNEDKTARFIRLGNAVIRVIGKHLIFSFPLDYIAGDEISYKAICGILPEKDITAIYKYGNCAPSGRFAVPIKLK